MRLFYAVNFTPETISHLGKIQNGLRDRIGRGCWTPRSNFHITLHFIGTGEEEDLPLLCEALNRAVSDLSPLSLEINRYGSFRQDRGSLIYLAANDRTGGFMPLAERLRENTGRGDRKPLKPHITLVRRAELSREEEERLGRERIDIPPVRVTSAELMESVPSGGGIVYRRLYSVPLRG